MKKLFFLLIVGSVLINIFAETYAMETSHAKIKGINNDERGYDSESQKTTLTICSSSSQEGVNAKEQTWLCIPLEEQQGQQEHIKLPLEDLGPLFNTILALYREESYAQNFKRSKIPVSMQEALQNFSQDFYIRGLRNGK